MRTWIFQANPDLFDVDAYLDAKLPVFSWLVRTYHTEIKVGDRVFIWRSGGTKRKKDHTGIIAEAQIVENARLRSEDALAKVLWKGRDSPGSKVHMRALLKPLRLAEKGALLSSEVIAKDSLAGNMLIIRRPAGTNFPVSTGEAIGLDTLWATVPTIAVPTAWSAQELEVIFHDAAQKLEEKSLQELTELYEKSKTAPMSSNNTSFIETKYYDRNPVVVAITRKRANFRCELPGCVHPSFLTSSGLQYCEAHHILPLSEGGADEIENMACLCAIHHREAHWGQQRLAIAEALRVVRTSTDSV